MTVKNVNMFIYKRGDFEVMYLFLYKDIMMIELQGFPVALFLLN
jgi:hypothetical protein